MIEKIKKIVGTAGVHERINLKDYCTFKIGGRCKALIEPASFGELFEVIEILENSKQQFKVIGNASNILFGDGFLDVFIVSTKKLTSFEFIDLCVIASCGANLSNVISAALNKELGGLEFLAGIPATIGGAIKMNAGANGHEISSVIKSVTYFEDGYIKTKTKEELEFAYRSSYFSKNPGAIILFAELELKKTSKSVLRQTLEKVLLDRANKTPQGFSAGCVFKNTTKPAGQIIESLGLKGKNVNDAQISTVHANFIVNNGSAKCKDVMLLINEIKNKAFKKYGIELKLEIEIIK